MSDPNDLDDLLDPRPISEFHKDLQHSTSENSGAPRSAADEVIEVVGDIRAPRRREECPECKSTEFERRKPLSGSITFRCRDCNFKWYGAPRSPAPLVLSRIGSPQVQVSGPYYRDTRGLPPADKHEPKYRRKGKSLTSLKKKQES